MPVDLTKLVQRPLFDSDEWRAVERTADLLHAHLNTPTTQQRLAEANQPGVSSAAVQETFLEYATSLGFESEKTGLFDREDLALRPDYFLEIGKSGIILEVERGKTTINNMDLLDFWKCHMCGDANYLFLLVPKELRQNPRMSPRNEYATVSRRLEKFFIPSNYTNVRGLCLFGY